MTERGGEENVGAPTNEVILEVLGVPYWKSIRACGLRSNAKWPTRCWLVGVRRLECVKRRFTIAVRATREFAGAGLPLGQFCCGIIRKSGSSAAALHGTLALDGMRRHGLELVLVALRIR